MVKPSRNHWTRCADEPCVQVSGLTDPVVEYSHDEGNAVIGGYVYRGSATPELEGIYVYGDWGRGKVWGIYRDGSGLPESRLLFENDFRIQSFAEGNDGEVYILEGTMIFRLENAEQSGGPQFPGKLSETGYVDRLNPREPAACMIPYEVNVPFHEAFGQPSPRRKTPTRSPPEPSHASRPNAFQYRS